MSSASDLGSIFIVLHVTALAFAQILNMSQTEHLETDWIVTSSEETMGLPGFVHLRPCFENVCTRDEVVTRFRLTQDQHPD